MRRRRQGVVFFLCVSVSVCVRVFWGGGPHLPELASVGPASAPSAVLSVSPLACDS